MGSYDGAESCELVGAYLLHKIKEKFGSTCDFGLYRDDGLRISKASPRQTELIKKDLFSIFSKYGLKITVEANKKTVNFLDVTLNLSSGKYKAYTKPGNIPLYVNRKSNHPVRIIENIPKSTNKRLSEISIDEYSFNQAAPVYQKALDDSGYNHHLTFTLNLTQSLNSTKRYRHRNIIWYNPPFSKNVAGMWLEMYVPQDPRTRVSRKSCVPQDLQLEHGQDQLQLHAEPQAENRWQQQINLKENDCSTSFESM